MDAFLGLDPTNKDKLKRSQDQKKAKDETDKKEIKLWIEKYRPKSLDEIVFQDNVVNALKKTKETGKMQHLLFYGPPGTGKTLTARAVAIYVFDGTITSSPAPISSAFKESIKASKPLPTPTQYLAPQ